MWVLDPRAAWACLEVLAVGSAVQVASGGLGRSSTYFTQHTCQSVFPHTATTEAGATAALLRGAAAPAEVSNLALVR